MKTAELVSAIIVSAVSVVKAVADPVTDEGKKKYAKDTVQ